MITQKFAFIVVILIAIFIIACGSKSVEPILKKGNEYANKGQYDLAIAEYSKAIEMNPKSEMAFLKRGDAYVGKWDYGLAIKDYSMAIEINPRFASAYIARGRAYGTLGQYDRALADINKAKEINPSLSNWLQYLIDQINARKKEDNSNKQPHAIPQYVTPSK